MQAAIQFGDVVYTSNNRVVVITLNRPHCLNAINETMPDNIAAAFEHANQDDTVKECALPAT